MNTFDVIVVGIGAMGASACCALAQRNVRVLGLEQFDIPHALGSSHGFSRMTRLAYYEHPDYVPLLKSAYQLWHEIEAEAGCKLIYVTGGLYAGPADGELISGSLAAAKQHHLAHEMLDRDELRRRYPQFSVPDSFVAMTEAAAGFLLPEKAVGAMATLALRRGAVLMGRQTVTGWSMEGGGIRVTTDRSSYLGGKLLICGGAWTSRLVKDLGVPLTVTRQVMGWVWPQLPQRFELGIFPVWAIDRLDGSIHYGFPMLPDVPGLKIAHHQPAEPADPDTVERHTTEADEQTFRPILREMLPDADGPLLAMRVCLYTSTPDSHFLIDALDPQQRVIVAGGFSGHGFKFAPVIGQALADLALTGHTHHPIAFLRRSRFGG